MTDETLIPSDHVVKETLEAEMPGLKILAMDRQTRWRPQWFMDVEWNGERTKLVLRGDRLQEKEQLDAIRPDLDGNAIMQLLGIPPGPLVGKAYKHLLALRMERGPLSHEEAEAELRRWAAENEVGGPGSS